MRSKYRKVIFMFGETFPAYIDLNPINNVFSLRDLK